MQRWIRELLDAGDRGLEALAECRAQQRERVAWREQLRLVFRHRREDADALASARQAGVCQCNSSYCPPCRRRAARRRKWLLSLHAFVDANLGFRMTPPVSR